MKRLNLDRIYHIPGTSDKKKPVIYWMQADVRAKHNPALAFAIAKANENNCPLLVVFCIITNYPEANQRHYKFLIEGLQNVEQELKDRKIAFQIYNDSSTQIIPDLAKSANCLVTDKGYNRIQRKWRNEIQQKIDCEYYEVDANLIVPVEVASQKEEYMAWTLRKKLNLLKDEFLHLTESPKLKNSSQDFVEQNKIDLSAILQATSSEVKGVDWLIGGTDNAEKQLQNFIKNKLDFYHEKSNDPTQQIVSDLSSYLHFGQISPIYIYLEIIKANTAQANKDDFLEQLLVRRELAFNFVYYNQNYDDYDAVIPNWAKQTLQVHRADKRDYLYSLQELENAQTHDKYWNAAQIEMVKTGKMHNYMRMYWGKKIIEWNQTPQKAFQIALYLNNKYCLDGRDPNSFAGIAWCFGKHDRAWKERKIFGKVRYMNSNGLKRKYDIEQYVSRIMKNYS